MSEDIRIKNQEIAKFMGLTPNRYNSNPPVKTDFVTDSQGREINLLRLFYHSDWNKIMEVCNHIRVNADKLPAQYIDMMNNGLLTMDKEVVYNAISKISEWYNWQTGIKLREFK